LIPAIYKQGVRIKTGLNLPPLNTVYLGQQRVDGDLSIAVDPNDSSRVYVCYGDRVGGGGRTYTLHVLKSTDSGATWSADVKTATNAVNPALAQRQARISVPAMCGEWSKPAVVDDA
jgi:hypothetical protein